MSMFISTPTRMTAMPPTVSSQPSTDLPLKNSTPIPPSSGSNVMPKLVPGPPKNRQNDVCTVTWLNTM